MQRELWLTGGTYAKSVGGRDFEIEHRLTVVGEYDGSSLTAEKIKLNATLTNGGTKTEEVELPLSDMQVSIAAREDPRHAGFLTFRREVAGTAIALEVDLASADADFVTRLKKQGLADFSLQADADLASVALTVRIPAKGAGWSDAFPFLETALCWKIKATAGGSKVIAGAGIEATAEAEVTACAKLALVFPPDRLFGLPNLRFALDLPELSIGTGWFPFMHIEPPLGSLECPALVKWFAALCDLDVGAVALPDFDWNTPNLPINLRLPSLPVGIEAEERKLILTREEDGPVRIQANIGKFVLKWNGEEIYRPDALEFSLIYTAGEYVAKIQVLDFYYPSTTNHLIDSETVAKRKKRGLPFGLLTLGFESYRLRLGVRYTSDTNQYCLETLLEMHDLRIESDLAGEKPLLQGNLRLLVLDDKPVFDESTKDISPFEGIAPEDERLKAAFTRYAKKPTVGPAFSYFENTGGGEGTDHGFTLLDGDFRSGERIYLAWKERTPWRWLRALGSEIFGTEPPDADDKDDPRFAALEIAWFDEGETIQARYDWADEHPPELVDLEPVGEAQVGECIKIGSAADGVEFEVPTVPGASTELGTAPADALRYRLPGVALEIAKPTFQSIVMRREADDRFGVGYLLSFTPPADMDPAMEVISLPPLVRARIGLSVSDPGGPREVVATGPKKKAAPNEPFATLGLSYFGKGHPVVRAVSWTEGSRPRFMETGTEALAMPSLIPPDRTPKPIPLPLCPGPPAPVAQPVALGDASFQGLRFRASGWHLALKLKAEQALKGLFADGDGDRTISFKIEEICPPGQFELPGASDTSDDDDAVPILEDTSADGDLVLIKTRLSVRLGSDFKADGNVGFLFDPGTFSIRVAEGTEFGLSLAMTEAQPPAFAKTLGATGKPEDYWYSERKELLGLETYFLRNKTAGAPTEQSDKTKTIRVLAIEITGGRARVYMPEDTQLLLRFNGLGRDSLDFWVDSFSIGQGGVDLDARLVSRSVNVKGLSRPFNLDGADLRIRSNRIDVLTISAGGTLPPDLIGEGKVDVVFSLDQSPSTHRLRLVSAEARLANDDKPLFSRGTRFQFQLSTIGLSFASDAAGDTEAHFYFIISGSAKFVPTPGEFDGGLLEDLKSVELSFEEAPLTEDFHRHLELNVALQKPVQFDLFKIFKMEIRSIGFAPSLDEFGGAPALMIGGQVRFAEAGDVINAKIDFHTLHIGPPRQGEVLPQISFKGLRVEIGTETGFRIAGQVEVYEEKDRREGFAGSGQIAIPGFPELAAAFAFVRVRPTPQSEWKHAWFIALEASRISYQIGPLPLYLREIGFGFGYRYTLTLISEALSQDAVTDQIDALLAAIEQHHSLPRLESWTPDVETAGSARWTVALEAVMTMVSANSSPFEYEPEAEKKLFNPLMAQAIASFRSDLTFLLAAKVWSMVSYDEFVNDTAGMRNRPLASGFMLYSPSQRRFLAHAASSDNPYLGPENKPVPEVVKNIIRNTHFEATLLIEPGLIHAELGWPDRLFWSFDIGGLHIECRGGVLYRLENDALIHGVFFAAYGRLALEGGISLGFVGVRVSAVAEIRFGARLLMALYLSRPLTSNIYAEIGLDFRVRFSISAWLRIKIGFVKISISISFSLEIQIAVALDVGWAGGTALGFRARATVMIGVFGRRLSARVHVGIRESAVTAARQALSPYMSTLLEPGTIPPVIIEPGGDKPALLTEPRARQRPSFAAREVFDILPEQTRIRDDFAPTDTEEDPQATTYVSVHLKAGGDDTKTVNDMHVHLFWFLPRETESKDVTEAGFYPVPDSETAFGVEFPTNTGETIYRIDDTAKNFVKVDSTAITVKPNPAAQLATEMGDGSGAGDPISLRKYIAACYLPKDDGEYRIPANDGELYPHYPTKTLPALINPPKAPQPEGSAMVDERVYGEGEGASPRRKLDRDDPYDQALAAALDNEEDSENDPLAQKVLSDDSVAQIMREQAHSSRSFLLQKFLSDLTEYAKSLDGFDPAPPTDPEEEPSPLPMLPDGLTVFSLGLVFAVETDSADPPDWLVSFTPDKDQFPKLRIPGGEAFATVKPTTDFDKIDFTKNVPIFDRPVTYLDDEIMAIGWKLEWLNEVVEPVNATDPEPFVLHYEMQLVDGESGQPLKKFMVTPCELLSPSGPKGKHTLLKPRYRFTMPLSDLETAGVETARNRRRLFTMTVTPVSHVGKRGAPYTFSLKTEPVLTPLPPDRPICELSVEPSETPLWHAMLTWEQPRLPDLGGAAQTDAWRLILRPLRTVPFGEYPFDTEDETDRGLISVTGGEPAPGDIIVRLDLKADDDSNLRTFNLDALALKESAILDHRGAPASESLRERAARFFARTSVVSGGGAWRLFLQPVGANGVAGSLATVPLVLKLPDTEEGGIDTRALPHFEWPEIKRPPDYLGRPRATSGDVYFPAPADGQTITYLRHPGRARSVTLDWPAATERSEPLHSIAGFSVEEAVLDDLTNFDARATGAERARDRHATNWIEVQKVRLADRHSLRRKPDGMGDVMSWESWMPSRIALTAKFPVRAARRDSPGWYSWAESDLEWPDPLPLLRDHLESILRASNKSASELLTIEDVEPPAFAAALYDIGKRAAPGPIHPYLAVVLGVMSGTEADTVPGPLEKLGRRFSVEVSGGGLTEIRKPLKWLQAQTLEADPFGWNALQLFGLAATVTVRDRITGQLEAPAALQERLGKALAEATNVIDLGVAFVDRVEEEWINFRDTLDCYRLIEIPIQRAHAARSGRVKRRIDDIGLSMVQISLRPASRRRFTFEEWKSTGENKPAVAPATRTYPIDVIFPETERRPLRFDAKREIRQQDFEGKETRIWVLHRTTETPTKLFAEGSLEAFEHPPLPKDELREPLSPFGTFAIDPKDWEHVTLGTPPKLGTAKNWKNYIHYLAAHFTSAASDTEPESAAPALETALLQDKDVLAAYLGWSDRFHRNGLLPKALQEKPGVAVATCYQNEGSPLYAAADAAGRLQYNHAIGEEWASSRSYRVRPLRRYQRLEKTVMGKGSCVPTPAELLGDPSDPVDVALPRIQAVEPPSLLGARILTTDDERAFYEVVVAQHFEEKLAGANIQVARKLSWSGTGMSFASEFVHATWLKRLSLTDCPRLPPSTLDSDTVLSAPAVIDADLGSDLLRRLPTARWGSRQHLIAAPPFYYKGDVTLTAYAEYERAPEIFAKLPPAEPPRTMRAHSGEKLVDVRTNSIAALEPARFEFTDVDERLKAWKEALVAEGNPSEPFGAAAIADHLQPRDITLNIRLPRFVEGLPDSQIAPGSAWHTELAERSVGLAPDPDVSLHLVTNTMETLQPVLRIDRASGESGPIYRADTLAPDVNVALGDMKAGENGWWNGLALPIHLAREARIADADGVLILSVEIGDAATHLPADSRLIRLAPLAVRLERQGEGLRHLGIAHDPVWVLRPHREPGEDPPALVGARDLFLGLRLACDRFRREQFYAAEQATEGKGIPEGLLAEDNQLALSRIEASAVAVHIAKLEDEVPAGILGKKGLAVMAWNDDETTWADVEKDVDLAAETRCLVTFSGTSADWGEIATAFAIDEASFETAAGITALAREFAAEIARITAWLPSHIPQKGRNPFDALEVHTTRGDGARTLWSERMEKPA